MFKRIKPALNGHSQKKTKIDFQTNYHLMQVKSIAECSKGPLKTGFAVVLICLEIRKKFQWINKFYENVCMYVCYPKLNYKQVGC